MLDIYYMDMLRYAITSSIHRFKEYEMKGSSRDKV